MEAQDRTIKCATCGREFIFTVKEQSFFASKGFKEPRHCRECRQQRKQTQVQALDQAVSGQLAPRVKEMFRVVCGHCNRETLVPFKPITGKPVLCKDCFIAQRYGVTPGAAGQAQPKKIAPEAEMPAPAQEAPPPPVAGGEPAAVPEPPGDDQQKTALADAPEAAPKPPITEQDAMPPPQAMAAKEPGVEP